MSKEKKRVYWVWADMVGRCSNKNHSAYVNYGGRGISVSDDWKESTNFLRDMLPRPTGGMIERRNNDLGYSKENCYWATRQIQNLNKRIYTTNKTGVRGLELRGNGYRVRLRRNRKIVLDRTLNDFFEACCLAIGGRSFFAPQEMKEKS